MNVLTSSLEQSATDVNLDSMHFQLVERVIVMSQELCPMCVTEMLSVNVMSLENAHVRYEELRY